jgi:hypothetical protein
MPINKMRLNAAERLEYRRCLAQLNSEGLDFGDDLEILTSFEDRCPLEITASDCGLVYDSEAMCADALLPLRMRTYETLIFENCDIESLSDEFTFAMPVLRQYRRRYYLGSRSFPVEEVLNHCFESVYTKKPFRLRRGQTVEGVVLGYVDKSSPKYLETRIVPVHITVVDSWHRRMEVEIPLGVRRVNQHFEAARSETVTQKTVGTACEPEIAAGGGCRRTERSVWGNSLSAV